MKILDSLPVCQLQLTTDGSHTLFLPELDEHYHSTNGAIREAQHVYIEAGFNQCPKDVIHVLELGFGTGLNALLTALESQQRQVKAVYTTLEKYPLPPDIVTQLNYNEIESNLFQQIHTAEWEKCVPLTDFFTLQKINTDFNDWVGAQNFVPLRESFDVVYYDAFAPGKQTEVWSQSLFDKIYAQLNPGGILTTYCAKGTIRRMMQAAGFLVERIPGPPGKREMLRARN
ncbi:MAG: tRNA (5-methylaminomethyl-2-thiouridine)(34)-methyltransferase MnmD [Candidatus Symbiothrix sp.]|jgi:tRNA U34 5-methylaminomethyl-2-thiouridine-forming methyltransferase MnmC|nr:tRNA (5-methylaminomethyl-2-thiouridine)(34)-methyltransferase MnmD [Candidatus Symbiothrix sp.]